MFNNSDYSFNSNISFNSVSGTLVKSTGESRFIKLHMDSPYAKQIFSVDRPNLNGRLVSVLQVMLCGDGVLLAEYVYFSREEES